MFVLFNNLELKFIFGNGLLAITFSLLPLFSKIFFRGKMQQKKEKVWHKISELHGHYGVKIDTQAPLRSGVGLQLYWIQHYNSHKLQLFYVFMNSVV